MGGSHMSAKNGVVRCHESYFVKIEFIKQKTALKKKNAYLNKLHLCKQRKTKNKSLIRP